MSHTFIWIIFIGSFAAYFGLLFYASYRLQKLRVEVREIIRQSRTNAGDLTLPAGAVVFRVRNMCRFAWLVVVAAGIWIITLKEGMPLTRLGQIVSLIFAISMLPVAAIPFVYEVALSERGLRVGGFFPREIRFDEIKRISMNEGEGGWYLLIVTKSGKKIGVNAGLVDFLEFVRLLSQKVSPQARDQIPWGR